LFSTCIQSPLVTSNVTGSGAVQMSNETRTWWLEHFWSLVDVLLMIFHFLSPDTSYSTQEQSAVQATEYYNQHCGCYKQYPSNQQPSAEIAKNKIPNP
jgi:hypothetical protein